MPLLELPGQLAIFSFQFLNLDLQSGQVFDVLLEDVESALQVFQALLLGLDFC